MGELLKFSAASRGSWARISVTPKAFETLLVLVQNSGSVVLVGVWPGRTAPQLSSDGTHIIFSSSRAGRFAIYQIDAR